VRGLSTAAKKLYLKGYKNTPVPIVSGNVSFYNESAKGHAIDPSPIICCIGIIEDYSKAITMNLKEEGNLLYLAGERYDELGGSEYYRTILKVNGKNVPKVRWEKERNMIYAVIDAIQEGYIKSCHDISNGGMIISLCEMVINGGDEKLSAEIEIDKIEKRSLRCDKKLFSESSGFIMEVSPRDIKDLEEIFRKYNLKIYYVGKVVKSSYFTVLNRGKRIINLKVEKMRDVWKNSLAEAIQ
jgi:phosphoribosylformylglycinamidine synthase